MDFDALFLGFRWGLMLLLGAGGAIWTICLCIKIIRTIGG